MRYTVYINVEFATKHQLNAQEAVLFYFLYDLSGWAKKFVVTDSGLAYWFAYSHYIKQVPFITGKKDTVYRQLKKLAEKGLVFIHNEPQKVYVGITELGAKWNEYATSEKNPTSDLFPTQGGKISGETSEKNPTNNIHRDNINRDNVIICGFNFAKWFVSTPSEKAVKSYLDYRISKKSPITQEALDRLSITFNHLLSEPGAKYLFKDGADSLLAEIINRGWVTVNSAWLRADIERANQHALENEADQHFEQLSQAN